MQKAKKNYKSLPVEKYPLMVYPKIFQFPSPSTSQTENKCIKLLNENKSESSLLIETNGAPSGLPKMNINRCLSDGKSMKIKKRNGRHLIVFVHGLMGFF